MVSGGYIHWGIHLLEQQVHTAVDPSTTNDDRILVKLLYYRLMNLFPTSYGTPKLGIVFYVFAPENASSMVKMRPLLLKGSSKETYFFSHFYQFFIVD